MSRIEVSVLWLFAITLLSGCLSAKKMQSFECDYSQVGNVPLSESIALNPVIVSNKGIEWVPTNLPTEVFPAASKHTSYNLKEYDIEVIGGKRRANSNIIDVDQNKQSSINKELSVFIKVKKKPSLCDTLRFYVDYKDDLVLSFDPVQPGANASAIKIDVQKIHDETYFKRFGCDLYSVKISSVNGVKNFYLSEHNSSLIVTNRGANGMNGENGANGAAGGGGKDGGLGFQGRDGEAGGAGGNGGNGGTGGNGGKVVVSMDSSSQDFLTKLTIDNRGGFGGLGGVGGVGGVGGSGGDGGERIIGKGVLGNSKAGGSAGTNGANGSNGARGANGNDGPPVEYIIW